MNTIEKFNVKRLNTLVKIVFNHFNQVNTFIQRFYYGVLKKNQHHFVVKKYHGCFEYLYIAIIFVMQAFVMQYAI